MKKHGLLIQIARWFVVLAFLVSGILVITLRHTRDIEDTIILGSILLMVGSVRILTYFFAKLHESPQDISIVSGISAIVLGIVFLVSEYDLSSLCLAWGVMEIILPLVEIMQNVFNVKKNKLLFVEIAVCLGTLVFGILLCIHSTEGLNVHLIYLSISLLLTAVFEALEIIFGLYIKKEAEE